MRGKHRHNWLPVLAAFAFILAACNLLAQESPPSDLPTADTTVLTIPNPQPFSGREGDPRPDWLGLGAAAFDVAPDGSFWIADTAVFPQRLLHFDAAGALVDTIQTSENMAGIADLQATENAIWLLSLATQPAQVNKLGLDGKLLFSAPIPEALLMQDGSLISNGIFRLWVGEDGALLSSGVNGLHRLLDADGRLVAQPIEALPYAGRSYHIAPAADGQHIEVIITSGAGQNGSDDQQVIAFDPALNVDTESYLGVNSDGSFALAVTAHDTTDPAPNGVEFVHYYSADGRLLGIGRLLRDEFPQMFHHSLAFASNGQVYQLVSYPDHSVAIIRLGFASQPPTSVPSAPTASATPLAPLLPTWTVIPPDASIEDQARETLLDYFTLLADGKYAAGGRLFGGSYEVLPHGSPTGDLGAYWEMLCQATLCLPVARLAEVQQTGEDQFLFYVEFLWHDGTIYKMGACCGGDPASTPQLWQFAYPVEKINGEWKVLRTPLYVP